MDPQFMTYTSRGTSAVGNGLNEEALTHVALPPGYIKAETAPRD